MLTIISENLCTFGIISTISVVLITSITKWYRTAHKIDRSRIVCTNGYEDFITNEILKQIDQHMRNTPGKIYTILNSGMGCILFVRRETIQGKIETYFLHSDNQGQYHTDDRPDVITFLQNYKQV